MLKMCGDVESNPGSINYPCKDCSKNVRNNQNAILCSECNYWFHMKCLKMSSSIINFYLKHAGLDSWALPNFSDSFFADEEDLVDQTNELLKEENHANQPMADIADIADIDTLKKGSDLEKHDGCTELYHLIHKRKQQPNEAPFSFILT